MAPGKHEGKVMNVPGKVYLEFNENVITLSAFSAFGWHFGDGGLFFCLAGKSEC